MSKDKSYLKQLAAKFTATDPSAMILNLAKPFLPKFQAYLDGINKPESEGGQLKDGERICYFSIMPIKGEMKIVMVFMKIENNQLVVTRQVDMSDFKSLSDGQ